MGSLCWACSAWVMMNAMSSLSTDISNTVSKNLYVPYPTQKFDLSLILTKKDYGDLIEKMRVMLTHDSVCPNEFEMPRLPNGNNVARTERYFLVQLINSATESITVAIDTTNLYVVGYERNGRLGREFRYFGDLEQGVDILFPGTPRDILPFSSTYRALAKAGAGRSNTSLGSSALEQAISDLAHYRRRQLARSFTVIIQMISEAIRFRYIENFLGNLIARGVTAVPDQTMLDLENQWGTLSDRIQRSVDGTINPTVTLTNPYDHVIGPVRNVNRGLAGFIRILLYVCNPSNNPNQLSLISTEGVTNCTNISEPFIRMPIEKGEGHMEAAGDICKNIREPTVRIVGRNGNCADVRDGLYNDGNSIRLWPCNSNEDVNQLWTLKADGTIRSNGKCLTTYGYASGNYVMIYNCNAAVPDATKWDIWYNGTIFHPRSKLVLSATSQNSDTTLTMQQNLYASSQAWVVTNNTGLTVIPIMNNVGDMCLEAADYNPQITYRGCQSGERRQSFAVYPDGTIRPDRRRVDCLTADTRNSVVVTAACNGGAEQRWSFNRDYTISTLDTGLAIDARNNVISLRPREARESQMWQAWFF